MKNRFANLSALVLAMALEARPQTVIDLRTQTKSVDFSGAAATKPFKTGTSLPTACTVGESFFKSNAATGENLYGCTSPDTWTPLGGSTKLQGRPVTGAAPAGGQLLRWNAGANQWEPADNTAAGVLNAVDKTAATVYSAGRKQTFVPDAAAAALRIAPAALPSTAEAGDVAIDSTESNSIKRFDGTKWVALEPRVNYGADFVSQTAVTFAGSTHNLATRNLVVDCFDDAAPARRIDPDSVTLNPITFDLTVSFFAPQTGRCTINGTGGGGAANGSGTGVTVDPGIGITVATAAGHSTVSIDTAVVPALLSSTAVLSFGAIPAASCGEQTMTLNGAATGDAVSAGWPPTFAAGLTGTMYVNTGNTVTVRLCNTAASAASALTDSFRATIVRSF